jgi:hypothetical protein
VVVENACHKKIDKMSVSLMQIINLRSRHNNNMKTKRIVKKINGIQFRDKIESMEHHEWCDCLLIPSTCPTINRRTCQLINVTYVVDFRFGDNEPDIDNDLVIPIVIGTMPLVKYLKSDMVQPQLVYEKSKIFTQYYEYNTWNYDGDVIESDLKSFKSLYPVYNNL